jgi:hypothetical protein
MGNKVCGFQNAVDEYIGFTLMRRYSIRAYGLCGLTGVEETVDRQILSVENLYVATANRFLKYNKILFFMGKYK